MALKVSGTGLDLASQKIINQADPSNPQDGATKAYVDNSIRGLDWKPSVKAASTANLTLSGTQTVDGIALVAGDRVLVKNQTDGTQNGIYVVASGAWSRASDFNDGTSITASAAATVEQGTTQADQVWMLTTDGAVTVGTTSLTFSQLGGGSASYTAGNGIQITGSTIAAKLKASGGVLADTNGLYVDRSLVPNKYAANVASGSTTPTIAHNLGTTDVQVTVYDISGAKPVLVLVEQSITDANNVLLTFGTAPTTGQYRAVVIG